LSASVTFAGREREIAASRVRVIAVASARLRSRRLLLAVPAVV
jgi:hypothetical protein